MNGVHDMGGMQGFGPVGPEPNEPVFHEWWEGRVFGMTRLLRVGRWNLDHSRHQLELLPPAEYLRMSYYERWLTRLVKRLLANNAVTTEELERGAPAPGTVKATPPVTVDMVPPLVTRRGSARREGDVAPRFSVGQPVRARNVHPTGHTRLPRYARGKQGVVAIDHGVFLFPDTNAQFLGEKPQHVYSVRFAARELWGEEASPRDFVHIDMWDDYLEPV
jgi:nitrile hydratase beta subunit